jgi:TRAP-type C4-dicarboxylate transport system substrate-binding protein
MTRTVVLGSLTLALSVLTLTGCSTGPSSADAAAVTPAPATPGTSAPQEPTALSIAFVGRLADEQIAHFQQELSRRSGGSMTTAIDPDLAAGSVTMEQRIIEAVAAGELDLGVVGVRAFRELGIPDLDALIAPMAIDSMAAQEAVLASDVPERMLAGLESHDLAGLAVIAGPLRRPVADRPLTRLEDFSGVPFHTFHGDVNAMTVEALGATHVDVAGEDRNTAIEAGEIRAYENTLAFFANAIDWRTDHLTTNVNLWPSMSVLIADPETLASLSESERSALVDAATDTMDRTLELLPDETQLTAEVCAGGGHLVTAPPEALAEIEEAVATVHAELRTDRVVAGYLDEIEALTAGLPPDSLPIPDGCDAA